MPKAGRVAGTGRLSPAWVRRFFLTLLRFGPVGAWNTYRADRAVTGPRPNRGASAPALRTMKVDGPNRRGNGLSRLALPLTPDHRCRRTAREGGRVRHTGGSGRARSATAATRCSRVQAWGSCRGLSWAQKLPRCGRVREYMPCISHVCWWGDRYSLGTHNYLSRLVTNLNGRSRTS